MRMVILFVVIAAIVSAVVMTISPYIAQENDENRADNVTNDTISKEEVIEIVDEKYPEREKDITLDEDDNWVVNFTAGNSTGFGVSITVDSSSGEVIEESCDGGSCNTCEYSTTEIMPWGEIKYYNYGCENPEPTCDVSNVCRPCETREDCIRKSLSSTIRLDIGQITTQHYYSVIGSGTTAHYNETSMNCTVYSNETYSEIVLDIVDCEDIIFSYANCSGSCS